jgi:hypothetical protein
MRLRRSAPLVAFVALAVFVACSDPYKHTNPYDPAVPVTIVINGPDSTFSWFEEAHYTATASPAFPDSAFQWDSNDEVTFVPDGRGTFTSGQLGPPPLYPATRNVQISAGLGGYDTIANTFAVVDGPVKTVRAWRHTALKTVVMTQRVTSILLRCPDTHVCDPVSVGGTWSVWVDGFDALNHKIVALFNTITNPATGTIVATFAVRDPSIASVVPVGVRASTVTALKTGSTWIVATRGALLDSIQLTVH